jgi:hypothetical protein
VTNPTALLRRLLLVLAFTAGAWEDLLLEGADVPLSGARPACDLGADGDADVGFVLNEVPAEAELLLERGFLLHPSEGGRRAGERARVAAFPPSARRIFHVPLG